MNEDHSAAQRVQAYLQEQADQPFGAVELVSGQVLAPLSRAGMAAAENLLTKADRALSAGDTERATRLIERAVRLDWDRHEQTAPAAFAVGMMLYNAVVDALEGCPEGDSRWLDAAVDAMSSATGWGQSEMRRLLLDVRQDYIIEPAESRTIERAVATVAEHAELRDQTLTPHELHEAVTSVLHTLRAYRAALASTAS